MAQQKLTVIVTCTNRKSATPGHDLMVRNLPPGEVDARALVWAAALSRSRPTVRLSELYSGETWGQVKRLVATSTSLGWETEVLVASAGLGLRSMDDNIPAYAATFSAGHPDSVAASTTEAQAWWMSLPRADAPRGGRAVWVLSEAYSRVIGDDLLERLAPAELLVFGGSKEIPDGVRIASNRSLRRALGGTVTSLNVRAATQWLRLSSNAGLFTDRAHELWRDWSDQARHPEQSIRRPMSDRAVLAFVEELWRQQPEISKTRALEKLRESGAACEQRRFSSLFQQAVPR